MKKIITLLAIIFCLNTNAQIITTIAGDGTEGYSGDGGLATATEISAPAEIAIDAQGNIYIADQFNRRVRMVNTAGIISTFAGNGSVGYSGDGGPATAAQLGGNVMGVTIDVLGNVYIADQANQRVRMVNTAGIINTIVGNGTQGYSGDGGPATAAELNNLEGLAIDAVGNLYIADYGNTRIRKVNTAGIISTIAGNGGSVLGDGGPATAAELLFPEDVAIDAGGNIYIADSQNNRIRKVNTAGIISTIAGTGLPGYGTNGVAATSSRLNYPSGVAVDASGNVYIADYHNSEIRKVNTAGIISLIAGNAYDSAGFAGDGGLATAAKLSSPAYLALDVTGNIYIADMYNYRIRRVTSPCVPLVSYTLAAAGPAHTWDAYPTYSPNVNNARWYWGDGKDTLALYPSHTYSVAGRYNICVTAYSACGDSAQSCQNDTVYRLGNNSTYSTMVYINVDSSSTHTTGINKLTNSNELNIYPNPNNGSFFIEMNCNTNQTIQMYDVTGKMVLSQTITSKTIIDASSLNEGVYNISIISNEDVVNKKLVIVR